ncbi:MAG: spermidine synthase [Bacteroidota bacterium]
MKDLYLYCVVVAGGAAVLALELLGTRILGPFYGVSLFLWSVLIAVTLLSLSIGYSLGGKWADKYPSYQRLNLIVGIAGIWITLIPWMKHPVLSIIEPLGLRPAVVIASLLFFLPPLVLLGMISPYAIKLKTSNLEKVGQTAGYLYALSTFASVISALATGSFLIPYVGVTRLTLLVGAILIILAFVGYILQKKSKTVLVLLPFLFVSIAGIGKPPGDMPRADSGLMAVEQSSYAEIRVVDAPEHRVMLIDGAQHASVELNTLTSNFPYVSLMDLPKYFYKQPGKMLLIGLGAGSMVKNYVEEGWKVDAVEIDPVVINLARKYFNYRDGSSNLYRMDGRQFLITSKEKYDVILLDAFGSSSIPFHLITTEVFQLFKSHLNDKGILAVNVLSLGWHDIIIRAAAATLHQSFEHVVAFPITEPPSKLGNVVLLAADRVFKPEREIERKYNDPDYRFSNNYWKVHGWDNQFEPNISHAPILTDDLNPIDVWSEEMNYIDHVDLHAADTLHHVSW